MTNIRIRIALTIPTATIFYHLRMEGHTRCSQGSSFLATANVAHHPPQRSALDMIE
jgi:hypothetical protein